MFPENDQVDFAPIDIPRIRRGPWGYVKIGAALVALGGAAWAWQAGYRPPLLAHRSKSMLEFVEIDRGDIDLVVVETGSIESSNNTTVRCKVEALLGMVGGSQSNTTGKGAGGAGGGAGQGDSSQGGSAAGGSGAGQGGAAADASQQDQSQDQEEKGGVVGLGQDRLLRVVELCFLEQQREQQRERQRQRQWIELVGFLELDDFVFRERLRLSGYWFLEFIERNDRHDYDQYKARHQELYV